MSNVELLAPCGSLESLNAAASEGADAVYLGLKSFNARIRSSNFAYSEFEAALNAMHRQGRKVYVAVNTVFIDRESDRIFQLLQYLWRTGADGIIVQDFGVLKICTENFPSLKLHASTQMNVSCAKACNLLSKAGVTRCVLSRELSFEELKSIRAASNIELEIFVHGALCVSASGLCLFSSCLGGKSANRGMCTQACRRLYTEDIDHMELAKGKFYFSPLDLQLIEKIPSLAEAGINAFKIEGRMKSAEYVGTVVRAYRKVIDSLGGDTETAISAAIEILKTDYARGKTLFHFNGRNAPRENNEDFWLSKDADGGTGIKLGAIVQVRGEGEDKCALIKCDVVLSSGDSIRVHSADDSVRQSFKLGAIEERNRNEYWINIPELIEQSNEDAKPAKNISAKSFTVGDSVYLIQTKANSRHYTPVIRKNFLHSQRKPGFDKAPLVKYSGVKKDVLADLPAGLYMAVSKIEDMYIVQSMRPTMIILNADTKTLERIVREKKPLPFRPQETIISLDPFFPQDKSDALCEIIGKLNALGYSHFIANNLGHVSILNQSITIRYKNKIIAGPYLYAFNRYAVSFLEKLNMQFFVMPFENSRQNLERTFIKEEREHAFVTVFLHPPLFRIQTNLKNIYDFKTFTDSRGENFTLVAQDESSLVLNETPFSICDKIPFLKQAGFKRFIVDFSGMHLNKQTYKTVSNAAVDGLVVLGASRFNYKNGFFTPDEPKPQDTTA